MKQIIYLLLVFSFFYFKVDSVVAEQQISLNEFALECECLTFQQIYSKYIELQKFNDKIKTALYERAPDFIYEGYIADQKQWAEQRNKNVLEIASKQDKEEMCRALFLEYLRIGTVLEDYNEYLYSIN